MIKCRNKKVLLLLITLIILLCVIFIRSIQYEKHVYDCKHMTYDLECFLNSLGIPTVIYIGTVKNSIDRHMWIAIPINGYHLHIDSVLFFPFLNSIFHTDLECYSNFTKTGINL